MSRSLWKFTVFKPRNLSTIQNQTSITETANPSANTLFFNNRASFISEKRINYRIFVYNGCRWYDFRVTPERMGHRIGEFAPTRKRPVPKKKTIKKKK